MADKVLSVYLAGSIRDNHPEDAEWREAAITAFQGLPVRVMNPLGGKTNENGTWTASGVPSSAKFITRHDLWFVRQADLLLVNFRALSQGYPNIGTLVEFGIAVERNILIYTIVDPDYKGHENPAMYNLHPFLNEFSTQVFSTVPAALDFLKRHLRVMSGRNPRFIPERASQDVREALARETAELDSRVQTSRA